MFGVLGRISRGGHAFLAQVLGAPSLLHPHHLLFLFLPFSSSSFSSYAFPPAMDYLLVSPQQIHVLKLFSPGGGVWRWVWGGNWIWTKSGSGTPVMALVPIHSDEESRTLSWSCEDTVRRWLSTSQEVSPP